jgi:hypothetical protein
MTQAIATKGLQVLLATDAGGKAFGTVTGISEAKPAVVTYDPAAGVTLVDGDFVKFTNSGFPELDGKVFCISANGPGAGVDPTDKVFTLDNSDTTNTAGTLDPLVEAVVFHEDDNLLCLCLSSLSRSTEAGETISVATFCDPSAQLAGEAGAGSLSWAGYMDLADPGFLEVLKANDDGVMRQLIIKLPGGKGVISMPITVNQYAEEFALNGAISFTGGAVINTKPTYTY